MLAKPEKRIWGWASPVGGFVFVTGMFIRSLFSWSESILELAGVDDTLGFFRHREGGFARILSYVSWVTVIGFFHAAGKKKQITYI